MMLSIFVCACWKFLYFLQRNVYSSFAYFYIGFLCFRCWVWEFFLLDTRYYHIYDLKIFSPICYFVYSLFFKDFFETERDSWLVHIQGVWEKQRGGRGTGKLCSEGRAQPGAQLHDPKIMTWEKIKSPTFNGLSHPEPPHFLNNVFLCIQVFNFMKSNLSVLFCFCFFSCCNSYFWCHI